MSDNVISIFDRFNTTKTNNSPSEEKESYQAALIDKSDNRVLRMQINFSDGGIDLCSYNQLADIYSAVPNYLSLIFRSGVIYIEGENIRDLLNDLREERVYLIQPFDPAKHKTPEKNSVVIHRIDWKSPDQIITKTGNK